MSGVRAMTASKNYGLKGEKNKTHPTKSHLRELYDRDKCTRRECLKVSFRNRISNILRHKNGIGKGPQAVQSTVNPINFKVI